MTPPAHLLIAVLAVSLLAAPSPAFAQAPSKPARFTIGVSGGIQQAAEEVSDHFSFPKNVETETIDVKYPKQPWGLIDLGASYRVWKSLGVGVAVTATTGKGKAEVTASVPHPFFFQSATNRLGDRQRHRPLRNWRPSPAPVSRPGNRPFAFRARRRAVLVDRRS